MPLKCRIVTVIFPDVLSKLFKIQNCFTSSYIFQKLGQGKCLFLPASSPRRGSGFLNSPLSQSQSGVPFLGGSGGSSPPKIRRMEAQNSPERGAQAPLYSSHTGKMTLFKPFRASLSKKFFETPQYLAPNGAPANTQKLHKYHILY